VCSFPPTLRSPFQSNAPGYGATPRPSPVQSTSPARKQLHVSDTRPQNNFSNHFTARTPLSLSNATNLAISDPPITSFTKDDPCALIPSGLAVPNGLIQIPSPLLCPQFPSPLATSHVCPTTNPPPSSLGVLPCVTSIGEPEPASTDSDSSSPMSPIYGSGSTVQDCRMESQPGAGATDIWAFVDAVASSGGPSSEPQAPSHPTYPIRTPFRSTGRRWLSLFRLRSTPRVVKQTTTRTVLADASPSSLTDNDVETLALHSNIAGGAAAQRKRRK
jgi:hypothetical protein